MAVSERAKILTLVLLKTLLCVMQDIKRFLDINCIVGLRGQQLNCIKQLRQKLAISRTELQELTTSCRCK